MSWFLSPALAKARDLFNQLFPGRSTRSDGTIGDAAHAARQSDHNPNASGEVDAWDITLDPAHGVTAAAVAAFLVAQAKAGVLPLKYYIVNRRIYSSSNGFRGAAYSGPDPHTSHVHVSVYGSGSAAPTGPVVAQPAGLLPTPSSVAGDVVRGTGKLAVMGALLAGGAALVVLGLYRGVGPALSRVPGSPLAAMGGQS